MAKCYTLDKALICEGPEIRIGDKLYRVDDRKKTVVKMMDLTKNEDMPGDKIMEEPIKLGLGAAAAKEVEQVELPFAAYTKLVELVTAAMIGEEPEELNARFQGGKESQ